ncbi:hypothetical protein [Cohnella yongneupensis]|uniref:DUF5405 domain-containing protein n=1 Tax=Cohnella yongneupensis TaxID=425006 RepID=A0ABW0QTX5_9BACL
MKVHIEGNLYLESDERQFVLKEYTGGTNKDGNELYKTIAYLTDIQHAFRYILRQKIKETTASNVKELIADLQRIESWLHSILDSDQPRGEAAR